MTASHLLRTTWVDLTDSYVTSIVTVNDIESLIMNDQSVYRSMKINQSINQLSNSHILMLFTSSPGSTLCPVTNLANTCLHAQSKAVCLYSRVADHNVTASCRLQLDLDGIANDAIRTHGERPSFHVVYR